LRKSHLKGFFNPTIYQHPLSNSDDPHGASQGVNNREWNGQNVSKRSDYVMTFPAPAFARHGGYSSIR
jgi:hypothetical protein